MLETTILGRLRARLSRSVFAGTAVAALVPVPLASTLPAPGSPAAEVSATQARQVGNDDLTRDHVGGQHMANALTGAGFGYGLVVNEADVIGAAHRMGLRVGHTLDPHDIRAVADAAWGRVERRMRLAGMPIVGKAEASDVAASAKRFGVEVGNQIDPDEVRLIVDRAMAQADIGGRHLAMGLGALGVDYGDKVNEGDAVAAARRYGVDIGSHLDIRDVGVLSDTVWRHVAWQMTLGGLPWAGKLEASDIEAHAADLGVDIGSQLDPKDARRVIAAGQVRVRDGLRAAGHPEVGGRADAADLVSAAQMYGRSLRGRLRAEDTREIVAHAERWRKGPKREGRTPRYATIGRVDLHLPGKRVEYAGLHQSASASALPQPRMGPALVDILPSRRRGTHRTGAVDVQMRPSQTVLAPVSGRVVETTSYALYGRYADQRIRIVPDHDHSLLVTVLHLDGVTVRKGQKVKAGVTPIAQRARKFPFASQIDYSSGQRLGHVHIETRKR